MTIMMMMPTIPESLQEGRVLQGYPKGEPLAMLDSIRIIQLTVLKH